MPPVYASPKESGWLSELPESEPSLAVGTDHAVSAGVHVNSVEILGAGTVYEVFTFWRKYKDSRKCR